MSPHLPPPTPMFRLPDHPDAGHAVAAPGGYEWWYFDADADDGRTSVVVILLDGFVFHPQYLRRYAAWIRSPSRQRPPVPADYPCAYACVYHDGLVRTQFMTQFSPGALRASTRTPEVTLGHNRIRYDGLAYHVQASGTPWHLTARGPQLAADQTLRAKLTFRPRTPGAAEARTFLSREMTGADHRWILAAPDADVAGHLDLGDGERLDFRGRGYHDHNFGTGPVGSGLHRWMWGRIFVAGGTWAFHFARPRLQNLGDEVHLLRCWQDGVEEIDPGTSRVQFDRKSPWGLAYPSAAEVGRKLSLANATVVDSAPFYLRVRYDARTPDGAGTALCEIAYPHRLTVPILGRMIEMSIDKRAVESQDR